MSMKLRDEVPVDPIPYATSRRDPIYLFCCHTEWRLHRDIRAYQELLAALDDSSEDIRSLAESLLHRSSPRPRNNKGASRTSLEHP